MIVNFKNKIVILSAKLGLFGDNRELKFGSFELWQNYRKVQQTKERTIVLWRRRKLGGGIERKSFGEKSKSGEDFSLAELQEYSCRR